MKPTCYHCIHRPVCGSRRTIGNELPIIASGRIATGDLYETIWRTVASMCFYFEDKGTNGQE